MIKKLDAEILEIDQKISNVKDEANTQIYNEQKKKNKILSYVNLGFAGAVIFGTIGLIITAFVPAVPAVIIPLSTATLGLVSGVTSRATIFNKYLNIQEEEHILEDIRKNKFPIRDKRSIERLEFFDQQKAQIEDRKNKILNSQKIIEETTKTKETSAKTQVRQNTKEEKDIYLPPSQRRK